MNNLRLSLGLLLIVGFVGCNKSNQKKSGDNHETTVQVWISTADQTKQLTQEPDAAFSSDKEKGPAYVVTVNDEITYQKWVGCGACTNDASSWLMFKNLTPEAKDDLMNKLFDKKAGIGMDWVRHQMGSGDAAVINGGWWTYDDMPKGEADPELAHFSIDLERDYILPTLKQALQINPNLKIVGSPWTPPGWMKTSADDPNPLNHGDIQPQYYDAFANYFVRFIQEYEKEGIPVYGVTLQNEPLSGSQPWQACGQTAEVQRDLIKNHFIPAFKKNDIDTKIYIFDHNWDIGWDFLATVYGDPTVYDFVAGSAWHHYGGLPGVMTKVHNTYPDKEIWFTEGCATTWAGAIFRDYNSYQGSFLNFAYSMINIQRNWCQAMMMYQIALDPDHGPAVFAPPTNYGMVTIDPKDGSITYRPEYYTLGHVSKFVYPDAYRIESDQYDGDIESVAFKNPDGSIVLVLSSRFSSAKDVKVKWGTQSFDYTVPGESMVTFKWAE
jgi:glucosylceramidase